MFVLLVVVIPIIAGYGAMFRPGGEWKEVTDFINNAGLYIESNPWLALVSVFLGGLLTASSPCVLAMIPLMISFVAGRNKPGFWSAFFLSLVFVLGLATTFTAMGMAAAAMVGPRYGEISSGWNWVVALVCLAMGLHLAGIIEIKIPNLAPFQPKIRGPLGAFILGLLFGLVSAPCAGPIVLVLLTYLAGSGASVPFGGVLLLAYALGHSMLILVAGTSMGFTQQLIESRRMTRATELMRRGSGVVIIIVGAYFAYRGWG
ncbi:MAG: cytochrome c biogenesis protein CcdA [Proteobacteria bacterium]|nr:cytochrome c biogenesis protein CcdA [Pseudomonadota bacterium]